VPLQTLQQQMGSRRIRSSQFQVSLAGDNVRFSGRAEGMGMDLIAAQEMAEHGRDAAAILRSFFPNARIQPWGN
jgi:peptidoglycan hydrolase-like amidase